LAQVAEAIAEVTKEMPDKVWLLLENTAGQSGPIGQNFEELAKVMEKVKAVGGPTERLGICVDTQHAFASGFDIRSEDGLSQMIKEIDDNVGLDKVKLIHVNDSEAEYNSKKDRHANLDEGNIGSSAVALLAKHKAFNDLPLILEVPGENKSGPRQVDVEKLKQAVR
jgi:deoxyribonuclease-4